MGTEVLQISGEIVKVIKPEPVLRLIGPGGRLVYVDHHIEINVTVFNKRYCCGKYYRVVFYDDLGMLVEFTSKLIPKELQSIVPSTVVTSTLSTRGTKYEGCFGLHNRSPHFKAF